MRHKELIKYWMDSSDDNYRSMQNMFNSGEYTWSLFVGHLCIEKLLKACYVKTVESIAPRTHDLYKVAAKFGLEMTEEMRDFTEKSILKIKALREWLLEKINS